MCIIHLCNLNIKHLLNQMNVTCNLNFRNPSYTKIIVKKLLNNMAQ